MSPTTDDPWALPPGWRWYSLTSDGDGFQFVMVSLYGNAMSGQGSTPMDAIQHAIARMNRV